MAAALRSGGSNEPVEAVTRRRRPTEGAGQDVLFTEFVAANSLALLRSAFLLTGDQQLAEDLVQDALARTYRSWNRLDRAGNATAYTRKTMYHLQVAWWRRRRVAENLVDQVPPVAMAGTDVDLEVMMHGALLKLPAGQRAAIILRYFEDRTEGDVARILGCSRSSVKTRISRGMTKLRAMSSQLTEVSS